jgi:phage anti-repressor protein
LEVDVWKTKSGEVIQEYKNNYILNEDIDSIWVSIFGLEKI